MRYVFVLVLVFHSVFLYSQSTDTTVRQLKEVVVTGYRNKSPQESAFTISNIKLDSANQLGSFTLTDLLAKQPGISMLSTGIGIAKPVIRGLYGNRVLVLLNGLKFDNQQWQEEHGLGLSTIGISRVELIKGPVGVLYGTESLGGIINILEDQRPADSLAHWDAGFLFNSNTLGGIVQAGWLQAKRNHWFRVRLGAESHADYSDGNNNRVLNSRFGGYCVKLTWGFERGNWTSVNNYSGSFNRFGFIFSDVYSFISADSRWSRSFSTNPFHEVWLNVFSSENTFVYSPKSKLQLNVGVQSNRRRENEGGGAISLDMHLLTLQYLLRYERQLTRAHKLVVSHLHVFEDNTNYGARKIVPDARMQEANISVFVESRWHKNLIWENGIGVGEKYIHTYFTPTVNGQGKEVQPFEKLSPYYNFFTGITYFPTSQFNLKANLASGVRVANLAELSSNGLHEGVFTYEIGNPDLKNEQLLSANLFANYSSSYLDFSVSPFYNRFLGYIYLTPVDEQWFGFPVYRYKQQNATQYGSEFSVNVKPIQALAIQITYSGMMSKTAEGIYTPYIPAQKIVPSITYKVRHTPDTQVQLFTNLEWNLAQNHTAPFEIKTPAYQLWNAGISTSRLTHAHTYQLSVAVNNILNTAYYDHLSRFKYFNLLNLGRNIVLNFKYVF